MINESTDFTNNKYLSYLNVDCNLARDLYAKCLKLLLRPKHWDTNAPETKYDHHEEIQEYQKAFNQFSSDRIEKDEKVKEILRELVGYNENLNRTRTKNSTRYRKISRLNSVYKQFLKNSCEEKPYKGLGVFSATIKREFIKGRGGKRNFLKEG